VLRPDEIQHTLEMAVIENLSVAESTTGTENLFRTYQTGVLDFTQDQNIAIAIPSGFFFYPDEFDAICTNLIGTVVTQPTIQLGISGNLTKYLSQLTTQLSAQNSRQIYAGLGADAGESGLQLGIGTPGAVSASGVYMGILLVKGVLIGA
jgi:hypothetical protein